MNRLAGNLSEHPDKGGKALTFVRIASKIQIDGDTGCWVWKGAIQSNGYGRAWNGKKVTYAHRLMYELFLGKIPNGRDIDHVCCNRACVNPLHLEPVTRSENLQRGATGENIAGPLRAITHCPHGHEYNDENTRFYRGRRHCRACARDRYHQRKKRAA